jgi:hypothetical protein
MRIRIRILAVPLKRHRWSTNDNTKYHNSYLTEAVHRLEAIIFSFKNSGLRFLSLSEIGDPVKVLPVRLFVGTTAQEVSM